MELGKWKFEPKVIEVDYKQIENMIGAWYTNRISIPTWQEELIAQAKESLGRKD